MAQPKWRLSDRGPFCRAIGSQWRALLIAVFCVIGIGYYQSKLEPHYPIGEWLAWPMLSLLGYALALQLAFVSAGYLLVDRTFHFERLPPLERLVFAHLLGLIAFVLGMYVAGAFGWYGPTFAVVWPSLLLAAGAPHWWTQRWSFRRSSAFGGWRWYHLALSGAGVAAALLLYLQSCTPDAINYDASWYHLPIAQDYAREGRIVPFPSDYNRAFPHLASIVFTWGFLVPGLATPLKWMLALHLEFMMVVWKMIGIGAAAAWMLRRRHLPSGWVGFFLFPGIFVYDQSVGGSSDHFLGYFAIPVLLAAVRSMKRLDFRWLALLGIALGGALLTKYQAVYLWGAAGALLAGRWIQLASAPIRGRFLSRLARLAPRVTIPAREGPDWRRLLWAPAVVVAVALFIASPHLIKNVIFYHNPLYPLAMGYFPGSTPTHEHSAFYFQEMYANRPYLPKGEGIARITNALQLLFTFSFEPHYSQTKGVPVVGSLFTLLTPLLFLVRRPGRLWLGALAAWVGIFVWANTYLSDRYLQGLITIPAAVTVALLVRGWQQGLVSRVALGALVAFQLIWSSDALFYSGQSRIRSAISLFSSGYAGTRDLERRLPDRRNLRRITEATAEESVLLVRNYRTTLGIDRTVYSDIQAWQSFIFYEPVKSPRALYELYAGKGVTHLLYPKGKRPPETLQAAVLFCDLAENWAGPAQYFGDLVLRPMPTKVPPAMPLYRVLVEGVPEYSSGLFDVDELAVYSRMPKSLRRTPKARSHLRDSNRAQLIAGANAVVVGPRGTITQRDLSARFHLAERFREYAVYVQR